MSNKLNDYPLLPADPGQLYRKLTDEFRATNLRVNQLSRGDIEGSYNAATSIPPSTEGAQGDFIRNRTPTEVGSAGSKYVVLGWMRLGSDWVACRAPTDFTSLGGGGGTSYFPGGWA